MEWKFAKKNFCKFGLEASSVKYRQPTHHAMALPVLRTASQSPNTTLKFEKGLNMRWSYLERDLALSFSCTKQSPRPPQRRSTGGNRWALRQVRKKWFSRLDIIEYTFYYPIKENTHEKENHHHAIPCC